jgi:hypothetical protein
MLFLNLDKLKINKSYQYQTKSTVIGDESLLQGTIAQIGFAAKNGLQEVLDDMPAIECVYEFIVNGDGVATEDEAADFISVVNIVLGAFFNRICQDKGRARERRLDVPENLKALKVNMSILKKAINSATIIDNFNIIIKYKDLFFMLVDEKDVEPSETATVDVEASHEED